MLIKGGVIQGEATIIISKTIQSITGRGISEVTFAHHLEGSDDGFTAISST